MMSLLYSMMMLLSPMSAGGNNGHHYGWRNQAPRSVPGVTVVSSPRSGFGGGNQNPAPGTTTGDPAPGPFTFMQ
ncbi:MAG TPA: hypothetical protein VGR66_09230 [Candidatus Eisenbacteria bacterium]|jgi:hypothetical protein|nr:hypothetical protein [Candidatus Eisenbacteria bacterium]